MNEAKSSKIKSRGDRTSRKPRRKPRGGIPGRRSRPRSIPETPPQGKRPSQPGGNKPTQRQTGSQGEPAGLGKELSQFQASLRVKTDTTGGTERWPQEGGGTTRETVSKAGIDNNPGRATTPKKLARLESNIQTKPKSSLEKARVYEKEPLPTPEGEEKRPINTLVVTRHRTEDRQRQPAGKRDSSQPSGRNHAEAPQ